MKTTADLTSTSLSIGRQPVFEGNGRLWGYQLFSVGGSSAGEATGIEPGIFSSLAQIVESKKKIIVDFSGESEFERAPEALPPAQTVIKVSESAARKATALETLNGLKEKGYLIAIDSLRGDIKSEPLYQAANFIVVDVRGKDRDTLASLIAAVKPYDGLTLASCVPDREAYGICKELGYSLFHGGFFKSPEKLNARRLSSNETFRLKLMQTIEKNDPNFTQLVEAIQSDATISFRLLSYLNSAAFAFKHEIGSIRQAIVLLGWPKMKLWLRVALLSDSSQSKEAQELVLLSAQRGMFLETLAREHDSNSFNPDSLYMLGIFSLLDALLWMPMEEIVKDLPIDLKLKAALVRQANNEYLPLLKLTECLEEARWPEADALVHQLHLNDDKVTAAFGTSIAWASQLGSVETKPRDR
jgi:EAL and modified HD-GYP domain-containing signal transduction protein